MEIRKKIIAYIKSIFEVDEIKKFTDESISFYFVHLFINGFSPQQIKNDLLKKYDICLSEHQIICIACGDFKISSIDHTLGYNSEVIKNTILVKGQIPLLSVVKRKQKQ